MMVVMTAPLDHEALDVPVLWETELTSDPRGVSLLSRG